MSPTQFAYREGGSCIDALLTMQHEILKSLDQKGRNAVRVLAMDFSKAFDTVKHDLLFSKLKLLPLNPYIFNWYFSFLTDRRQQVVCNSITCDWISVNKGTTQGSVSGPYLFHIFKNDLQTDPESNSLLFKYADDSTLIIPVWKEGDSNTAIHVVNNFIEWSINKKCNFSKCKEMVFRKKGYNNVLETVQNIPQHPELCILGVTFQENCRFSIHVKSKLAAANKCLYILRTLRKEGYCPAELDNLFSTLVLPKPMYGISVYGSSPPELYTIQCFLDRCHKRRYTSSP